MFWNSLAIINKALHLYTVAACYCTIHPHITVPHSKRVDFDPAILSAEFSYYLILPFDSWPHQASFSPYSIV